ncbi:hypothetical protein [Bacillus rubiinfantis]|uniref:hypothetical protein n=1 Tax=Bacillus rubiinfantis TaxID=1499680 RepID=UPI0005A63785|nr:hypothetical protein [Bacillus rubiinfantis]
MKKLYIFCTIILISAISTVIFHGKSQKALESITFFPLAANVAFNSADTSLLLTNKQEIAWQIQSKLDRKAYLRQDAGLLYKNGRLVETLGAWKANTRELHQFKSIPIRESSLLDAITFHHAELHEKNGQILSAQTMSQDLLYVVKQQTNQLISFRQPTTKEQDKWRKRLNQRTERMLRYSWNKVIRHYSIHLNEYHPYPLNDLTQKAQKQFPGFTKAETENMIGRLWEGLYKNYLLGITKQDGTKVSSIGSTLPLILVSKDKSHLLVLTETADNDPILLRQLIAGAD